MGQLKSYTQYNMKLLAVLVAPLLPSSRQNLRPMPTMVMDMAVDTVMVVMDMVDTVASVPPMPMLMLTMVMDVDAVMDMVVTDTVDTVERDQLMPNQKLKLSHGTDMDMPDTHTLMVDTDTHTLMDTVVVMDMAVTDTVDTVERDPLSHTTDMVDTEDMEVTDMVVVMATAMDVKAHLQEAKSFHYLIFQIDF